MEFTYFFGKIELICTIEESEIDCFSPVSGHYTKPGDPFVYSVSHKGEDVTELLADDVIEDILREFLAQN
jgi:hypothetical protein